MSLKLKIAATAAVVIAASEVVAEGKVRTPNVAYWMPCLVVRSYHTYTDNLGISDNYWLYYRVVPNGFSGANGVAQFIFNNYNSTMLAGFRGVLDGSGQAQAVLTARSLSHAKKTAPRMQQTAPRGAY